MSDLALLRLEIETCMVMAAPNRFECVNSPGGGPGPRLMLVGCAEGNAAAVHVDLDEATALGVLRFVDAAPAWADIARLPRWITDVAAMVDVEAATLAGGPAFHLPQGKTIAHSAHIVAVDTEEGAELLARLRRDGMPPALVEAGYTDTGHLWAPWCAAMAGDEIAALCCAARLGARGAEAGLYTFPSFRGRGFGAAVTAAWSRLPGLAGKALFYSTQYTNTSSQRVTQRLGLRRIGSTVGIG